LNGIVLFSFASIYTALPRNGTGRLKIPRNGAGTYSLPPGTAAVSGELATAEQFNTRFDDVAADLNFLFGQIAVAMPVGGIIMWSGAVSSVPTGWRLCDGTGGTPDLRSRFVVGAGSTYNPGNTGGASTVALTAGQLPGHTHAAGTLSAASGGAHTHTVSGSAASGGAGFSINVRRQDGTNSIFSGASGITLNESGGGGSFTRLGTGAGASATDNLLFTNQHTHSLSGNADAAGTHTHTVTGATASTGAGEAHENLPPYYALAFIMRVS
jgi:microcystin-dependent protein